MQGPHAGHHHHPPRLRLALAVGVAGLSLASPAAAGQIASLPSPLAPLSPSPPLGLASASAENVRHRVAATLRVHVSLSPDGKPFAVAVDQSLSVGVQGDYFFTIGAPVLAVRAPAGSASTPGMRTASIVWAGFNPGERLLVARATLEPAKVVATLPIRIRVSGETVTLENATGISVGSFSADAPRAPLVAYLTRLRAEVADGRMPLQTTIPLASAPTNMRITVTAPLHVTGTIGAQRIDLMLGGRTRIHGHGRIDLHVEPVEHVDDITATTGRALLREAIRATLTLARANQYDEFLGNPDPAGASRTVYAYRSASPPRAAPIAAVGHHRRTWVETALLVAALAAALAAGAALWARS